MIRARVEFAVLLLGLTALVLSGLHTLAVWVIAGIRAVIG